MSSRQQPVEKRIHLQDIADRLQVSRATVSRALHHHPAISAETIARVNATAAEMGYDPSLHSRSRQLTLHTQGNSVINQVVGCLLPMPDRETHYMNEIYRGVLDGLMREDFALVTSQFRVSDDQQYESALPSIFARGEVDGVILLPYRHDLSPLLSTLRNMPGFGGRPVVSLLQTQPSCPAILTDDLHGAYESAIHLLDLGHCHLLQFVLAGYEENMERRLSGIRRAFHERGIDPQTNLHFLNIHTDWLYPNTLLRDLAGTSAAWMSNPTRLALVAYLTEHPEVTAILARNDASAIRAWYTLEQIGLHVPADMSVIGFDDTDAKLDAHGSNLLTSVRLPLAEAGQEAAQLMVRLVKGEEQRALQLSLPTEVVIRASTARRARGTNTD